MSGAGALSSGSRSCSRCTPGPRLTELKRPGEIEAIFEFPRCAWLEIAAVDALSVQAGGILPRPLRGDHRCATAGVRAPFREPPEKLYAVGGLELVCLVPDTLHAARRGMPELWAGDASVTNGLHACTSL